PFRQSEGKLILVVAGFFGFAIDRFGQGVQRFAVVFVIENDNALFDNCLLGFAAGHYHYVGTNNHFLAHFHHLARICLSGIASSGRLLGQLLILFLVLFGNLVL